MGFLLYLLHKITKGVKVLNTIIAIHDSGQFLARTGVSFVTDTNQGGERPGPTRGWRGEVGTLVFHSKHYFRTNYYIASQNRHTTMKMHRLYLLGFLFFCVLSGCTKNENNLVTPEPPAPQGPSGYITFFNTDNFNFSHLTTLKYDGTESKIIFKDNVTTGELNFNETPRWSFDRTKIIFASDRAPGSTRYDLFVINSDGSGLKQLTNTPDRSESFPSFSPDGQTILYSATGQNSRQQLFLCNADGSNPRQLTSFTHPTRTVACRQGLWSHDGNNIYFISDKDTTASNIYSIKADGTEVRRITTNNVATDWFTSVSKTGKLAFYSSVNGTPYVFTVNADGTNRTQVTNFWSGDPAISPDGSMIAFISNKDKASNNDGADLYTIKADGTDLKRLTNTPGDKFYPDWK